MRQALRSLSGVMLLCAMVATTEAAIIGFPASVTNSEFDIGDIVQVPLVVQGLANTPESTLGAFDVTFTFDDDVLSLASAIIGDPFLGDQLNFSGLDLVAFGAAGVELIGGDTIRVFEISFDPPDDLVSLQLDAFVLARFEFVAVAVGRSPLAFQAGLSAFSDAIGGEFMPVTLLDGSIKVPGPPVALLSVAPLLVMFLRRRLNVK